MARPSKLTPAQWGEIERRFLAGETSRALALVFDISEAGIRKKFGSKCSVSAQSAHVRTLAGKLAEVNAELQAMPPVQRAVTIDLSEKLRNISESVASAAELGAKTGHRLHALANSEVCKVDDAAPLSEDSIAALKGVGVLTKLANESLMPALNLLSANKERAFSAAPIAAIPATHMTDDELASLASGG